MPGEVKYILCIRMSLLIFQMSYIMSTCFFSVETFMGILCIIYRSMLSESDFQRTSGNLGAFTLYVAFIFSVGVGVSLSIFRI